MSTMVPKGGGRENPMNLKQKAFEAGQRAQREAEGRMYEMAQIEALRAVEAVEKRKDLSPKQRKALAAEISRGFFEAHNPAVLGR